MRKILLFGTCEYELIGLKCFLSEDGYSVGNYTGDNFKDIDCDVFIVALSSEPVMKWGRFFSLLYTLSCDFTGKIILLVPEKIGVLNIFPGIDRIIIGKTCKNKILSTVNDIFSDKNNKYLRDIKYLFSPLEWKYLKGIEQNYVLYKNGYYYSRSSIVNKIGVENMHIVNLIGVKYILNYFLKM
ncbi:TPA: hypothetical protein ACNEK2_002302 [Escherichia coli]